MADEKEVKEVVQPDNTGNADYLTDEDLDQRLEAAKNTLIGEDLEKSKTSEKEVNIQPDKKKEEEKLASEEADRLAAEEAAKVAAAKSDETGKDTTEDKTLSSLKLDDVVSITEDFVDKNYEQLKSLLDVDLTTDQMKDLLSGVKGRKTDLQFLKNYVHSEKYTRDLKDRIEKSQAPTEDTKALQEQVNSVKQKMFFNALKSKYTDLPADFFVDEDVQNYYLREFRDNKPLLYEQFLEDYRDTAKNVDGWGKQYVERQTNWKNMLAAQVKSDVDKFESEIKSFGVTLKDLGIDSIDEAYLQKNVFFDDKGIPDKVVVQYDAGIPIVIPNSIYSKLISKHLRRITELSRIAGQKEGLKNRIGKEENPSISSSGKVGAEEVKGSKPTKLTQLSDEALDKLLEEEKEKVKQGL